MITNAGEIPQKWQQILDRCFGERDWRKYFYEQIEEEDLIEGHITKKRKSTSPERIEEYILQRLRTIFPAVANKTYWLRNKKNQCMYLLAFACSSNNKNAQSIALRIANHILKD
jgi:hypothetical protein